MNFTQVLKRIPYAAGVLAGLLAGCAARAPADAPQVAAVDQALTVIDCQNQAAQCLGTLPSPDKITSCRTDMQSCLMQAQSDQQAQATALGQCTSDAMTCGQSAVSFADAMTCRQTFQDCVNGVVQLPPAPTTPPPPTFPMLPGAGSGSGTGGATGGGALAGADQCRQDALSCVQSASGPGDVATCAGGYRTCVGALLPAPATSPVTPPPLPSGGGTTGAGAPGLPGIPDLQACRQDALTCVGNASGPADIAACNDAYRTCAGLPALPTLPTLPSGGGGAAGAGGAGTPGAGTDCLQALSQCLLTGGMPTDCASQASDCAGVAAPMLPTPPSLPGLPGLPGAPAH